MSGAAVLLLLTSTARGADQFVACAAGGDPITPKIELAGPGDTIFLTDSGVCTVGQLVLLEAVSIEGSAGQRPTISGTGDPVIRATTGPLTLAGFDLQTAGGGAVRVEAADVTLDDLVLRGAASGSPAVVVTSTGTATLTGVTVTAFSGVGLPGGLQLQSGAQADLVDCRFDGVSGGNGGAIFADAGAVLDVVRTTFCNVTGTPSGGAIRADSSVVTVSASVFQNSSSTQGSAIFGAAATLTVRNADFVGNPGNSVIEAVAGSLVVDSSLFYDNDGTALVASLGSAATAYDLFWQNGADVAGNASLGSPVVQAEPMLARWTDSADCTDDLRPAAGSPMIGAGDPAYANPDIGRYGGDDLELGWDDLDLDGDPYTTDCDDLDPLRSTLLLDVCNEIDDDCSGVADDDPAQITGFADLDGDGYGDPRAPAATCAQAVEDGTDCNDGRPDMHPGGLEDCDHADDDCDGVIDDLDGLPWWGPDDDEDGYGTRAEQGCFPAEPTWAAAELEDCDDLDPLVHPLAPEICDGADTDCDLATPDATGPFEWRQDLDGDGFGDPVGPGVLAAQCAVPVGFGPVAPDGTDCDDATPAVHPRALELCNLVDDDCDGIADGLDPDVLLDASWPDLDGDGAGAVFGSPWVGCEPPPAGYVPNAEDCDDLDPERIGPLELWPDADGDGYGNAEGPSVLACVAPGHATNDGDCNDGNPSAHRDAVEVADDEVDNDCDGAIDERVDDGERTDRPPPPTDAPGAGCGCEGARGGGALPVLVSLALIRAGRRSARSGRAARAR